MCGGQANVQSELDGMALDGMARNRSIYARTGWNGAEPLYLRKNLLSLETLSALYVLRNRRKAHSNTSSTATQRGTAETRWPPGHVIVRTYMPIGNRDVSLLSMACLALAINCTRI